MNDDFQDWLNEIESVAQDMGERMQGTFQETMDAVVETTDWMIQIPLAIAEQMENAIVTEMNQFIDEVIDWFQPPINVSIEFDTARFDIEWDNSGFSEPWVEHVEPKAHEHAACIGCQYYHGRMYNGNLLVCGMHPYGWDGPQCPDWIDVNESL